MHFVPLGQNIATANFEWRLSIVTKLEFALEVGNFQDSASRLFRKLPIELKNWTQFTPFSTQSKKLLMHRAKEKLTLS